MAGVVAATGQTDFYSGLGTGYDISWPQCTGALPSGGFGIVGVNHGRPFTFIGATCQQYEYSHASQTSAASLYINTGYSGAYRKSITPLCASAPASITGSALRQAWSIGCSESDTSLNQASGLSSAMWWLDVEVGNSWSTSNLGLNRETIQGAVDHLYQSGFQVGVYSTRGSWAAITGSGFTPQNSVADWVAGGSCTSSFDSNKVWLSQFTSGGFDYDTAC